MSVIHVNDLSFKAKVLESSEPVLVDFWAEWCGPCKSIASILEELAREMLGRVTVAKLNVDDNTQIANDYGIRGIPTLMLFHEGQVLGTRVGSLSRAQLFEWIDPLV